MMPTIKRYKSLIENGDLQYDPAQEEAIIRLSEIGRALLDYAPEKNSGILSRLFKKKKPSPPQGLYMWGGVGRGKTLLMDLFFNNTAYTSKYRVHFHEFMLETHKAIAHWRKLDEKTRRQQPNFIKDVGDDPIPPIAKEIAAKGLLLCFDEFQVSDIADAMILGRLFDALFEHGVVVIATSNRSPDDLYKDGLNRQLFLPFIETLKSSLDVLELVSARDYRLERLSGAPVYYTPLGTKAKHNMDNAWSRMLAGAKPQPEAINIGERLIKVPQAARGAARFSFDELCNTPLGAADYLAISRRYATLFIDDIPIMTPENRNEAKRFVTLIDAIYEACGKLVCSAEASPDQLYQTGDGSFEFERTVSRLLEMQSQSYLASEHCPQ